MVQMIASATNVPAYQGGTWNTFKYTLPNSVQSGNALLVAATWPSGVTPTISDNVNGTWGAAIGTAAGGTLTSGIFLLTGAAAGVTTITATLSSAITNQPFHWNLFEFTDVTGHNGFSGAFEQTGPNLAAGSFTPGNNNAHGGNLILSYFCCAFSDAGSQPSIWTAGSGHTLLEADLCGLGNPNNYFPHATQYVLQTTQTAINPGITATGDTTDAFNCVAIALTAGAAGSPAPAGIYIRKIIHQTVAPYTANTLTLQTPFTGNLRVITNRYDPNTTVTDSDGNTWTNAIAPGFGHGGVFAYMQNAAPDTNATLTLGFAGGFNAIITHRIYDIQGAAPSSYNSDIIAYPFTDYTATLPNIPNAPIISPAASHGVTIAVVWPEGNGQSCTSPAAAIYDSINYSGAGHSDGYECSDLIGHLYFSTGAQQTWNWTTTTDINNTAWGYAATFS
jgi:hypothetical protein